MHGVSLKMYVGISNGNASSNKNVAQKAYIAKRVTCILHQPNEYLSFILLKFVSHLACTLNSNTKIRQVYGCIEIAVWSHAYHVRLPCSVNDVLTLTYINVSNCILLLKNIEHEVYRDMISVMFCLPTPYVFIFDACFWNRCSPSADCVLSHSLFLSFKTYPRPTLLQIFCDCSLFSLSLEASTVDNVSCLMCDSTDSPKSYQKFNLFLRSI